jgi:hypothetical protein
MCVNARGMSLKVGWEVRAEWWVGWEVKRGHPPFNVEFVDEGVEDLFLLRRSSWVHHARDWGRGSRLCGDRRAHEGKNKCQACERCGRGTDMHCGACE